MPKSESSTLQAHPISVPRRWRIIGWILVAAYVASSLLRFEVHPSGPHTYRQSDTIGMSISLAEAIKAQGWGAVQNFLAYPTILQRGLSDGINASEFPLTNALTAPFYAFASPHVATIFASLLILLLNLAVAYRALPRLLEFFGVRADGLVCLLLWLTSLTLGGQSNVIMPEGVALPLLIVGMTACLEAACEQPRAMRVAHALRGVLATSLSVATKPTVAVGLLVMLAPWLAPRRALRFKKPEGKLQTRLLPLMLAAAGLLFPAYWYMIHAPEILRVAQGPQIFALAHFTPFHSLAEITFPGILRMAARESAFGELPFAVGWVWIAFAILYGQGRVVALYLVALLASMSLGGAHLWVHAYYFIGSAVPAMLLMARSLASAQSQDEALPWTGAWARKSLLRLKPALPTVLGCLLAWGVIYNIRVNVWTYGRDHDIWPLGERAANWIPDGSLLITDDGAYPTKLLMIGRSGVAAGEQVLQACSDPRYINRRLAVVLDRERFLKTGQSTPCGKNAAEIRQIRLPFAAWTLILVEPQAAGPIKPQGSS